MGGRPRRSTLFSQNLKKCLLFVTGEGSRVFVVCFLHARGQTFWYQTPGRCPPRISELRDQRVAEPLTSVPRSEFMTRSLVLSIDVCRGLRISPRRMKHLAEFSQADLGPTSAQENIFFVFFGKFASFFFSKFCAHSEQCRNLMAGIFEIQPFFFGNIAFPLSST